MFSISQIILFFVMAVDSVSSPVMIQPAVSSSLSVDKCAIGDTFDYFVSIDFLDNPAYWFWDSIQPPTTSGLNFIGESRKTITFFSGDSIRGKTIVDWKFSPIQTGDITMSDGYYRLLWIPDGDTTNIDTVMVKYPGFAITGLPEKRQKIPLTPILMMICSVIFLIVLVYVLRKISKDIRTQSEKKVIRLTASEKALEELSKISLNRDTAEKIFDTISKVVREYISAKYKIAAAELSTNEIIDSLERGGLGGHKLVELKKILNYCDDVRFAKIYPERSELEEILELAKKFVSE